jgi:preprotein translocase subunit SecD
MIIINGSASSRMLAGLVVLLVPIALTYVNSKIGKVFVILILAASLVYIVLSAAGDGVIIKSIEKNSTEFNEGLRTGMILKSLNGEEIKSVEDYSRVISGILPSKEETKIILGVDNKEIVFLTNKTLSITVENIKMTNLKTGLDLSGGARALVSAEKPLTSGEMSDLVAITSNRLNVFGISDISVRSVSDLEGNNYMLVEVAGVSPSDLKELVAKQGKFEARIGNGSSDSVGVITSNASNLSVNTGNLPIGNYTNDSKGILVFEGGKGDISDVCRNRAECAGIQSCQKASSGYACSFRFTIYLTEEAAKKHAAITQEIPLDATGEYLADKLYLYVDDSEVDSLLIGADLKGQVTTQVSIQGSGTGETEEDAYNDAKASMNKLQTILITGSLPYKLNLVKLDSVSPMLGKEFTNNIIRLALIVFAIICALLFIKYRKIKITLSVILTVFSEAVLTLAVAALIRWNLDAPSIAGIIAGMGTGVNDQIIIIDESVSEEKTSLKERIKRALFIIVGAFFTIFAAMLPLFWAGTGLLRGFALTTLIGVTVGIVITRPAFADIMKKISE